MKPNTGSLRYFGRIKNGTTPASSEADYWDGDILWATPEDLGKLNGDRISTTKRQVTLQAVEETNLSILPAGAVLISTRAPIGHMGITDEPMAFNQGCRGIIPDDRVHGPFLYYLLKSRAPELNAMANGTTFVELSRDELAAVQLAFPPLEKQRRIAAFLDEKTGRIDALIAKKQALLERLAEKRQAVITQAVTKGLNPSAPMKDSGIDWLGPVPAHWEVKRLKHLVLDGVGLQMGPFGGMLTDLAPEPTGFKLYGQENTISGDFDRGDRWVDEDRYVALARYQIKPGDLVITRKGSLGSCRRVPEKALPGLADSDTIAIRFDEARLSSALAIILLHDAKYIGIQIEMNRRGAILAGLNTTVVGNLWVACPPLEEQPQIIDWCEAFATRTDQLTGSINTSIKRVQDYRAALITAAVTDQIAGLQ